MLLSDCFLMSLLTLFCSRQSFFCPIWGFTLLFIATCTSCQHYAFTDLSPRQRYTAALASAPSQLLSFVPFWLFASLTHAVEREKAIRSPQTILIPGHCERLIFHVLKVRTDCWSVLLIKWSGSIQGFKWAVDSDSLPYCLFLTFPVVAKKLDSSCGLFSSHHLFSFPFEYRRSHSQRH